jgi:hypothetical protein
MSGLLKKNLSFLPRLPVFPGKRWISPSQCSTALTSPLPRLVGKAETPIQFTLQRNFFRSGKILPCRFFAVSDRQTTVLFY